MLCHILYNCKIHDTSINLILYMFLEIENEEQNSDDEDDAQSDDDEVEEIDENEEEIIDVPQLKKKYAKVIVKWRKIVNKFNGRSTVQKDQLQDAIKKWQKKQVMILFVKILKMLCYILYSCKIHNTSIK